MRSTTILASLLGSALSALAALSACTGDDLEGVDPFPDAGLEDAGVARAPVQRVNCQTTSADELVRILNLNLVPSEVTVGSGAVVEWFSEDDQRPHALVSGAPLTAGRGELFQTELINTFERVCFRFNDPGAFTYHCEFHPFEEQGVVSVLPPGTPQALE